MKVPSQFGVNWSLTILVLITAKIYTTRAQFNIPFFSGGSSDSKNKGGFNFGFESKNNAESPSSFTSKPPPSPPGFEFILNITGSGSGIFPFGNLADLTGELFKGLSFGKFILDSFNLFLNKGLFFTTNDEKGKTPFSMKRSSSSIKDPKSKNDETGDMTINSEGDSFETIISIFELIISASPHRAHPFYLKRDAAGLDPYALIGDILSITVTAIASDAGKAAPVVIIFWQIVQRILVHQIRILIGYPYGDGVMTAGTGLANVEAVKLALFIKIPTFMLNGFLPPMTNRSKSTLGSPAILISEGNTDIFNIFGIFSGIPKSFLIKVQMDKNGRMDPVDLEKKIQKAKAEGKMPFLVIASLGTTNLGAVDPIAEIVKITEKHDLWLHIDGTHGGPALFSNDIKEKWAGVEKSNSFTFSFSSLLGVPEPSSFFIVRNDGILKSIWDMEKMFTLVATHIGPQFLQNPKMTDAGKTWLMWFIKGYRGLREHVEYSYSLTRMLRKKIKERPNFELLTSVADTPVVPFRVIPKNMKTTEEDGQDYVQELDKFTTDLKWRLLLPGLVYISTKRALPNEPKHFMFPLTNSILTEPDIDYVLDTIDCHAKNIEKKNNGLCTETLSERINKASSLALSQDGYAPYVNALMPDIHLTYLTGIFELIAKMGTGFSNSKDSPDSLDLGLTENGMKQNAIMPFIQGLISFLNISLKFNLFKMMDKCMIVSLMADFTTTFMSPSMESKEASPPFVRVKNELEQYIRTRVGYPNGEGDGVTVPPDGSVVTQYTISVAKSRKESNTKSRKESNDKSSPKTQKPLVMFISAEAHYSWKRGAITIGLGSENCIYIPIDPTTGQMDLDELLKAIESTKSEDKEPFLVVGTLGTDVLGSNDNFNKIATICEENNIWFHVDGRNGGPLILSDKQKKKIKGIQRSDSFSFSPSKFYPGDSMTFAVLVTREQNVLKELHKKDGKQEEDDDDDSSSSTGARSSDEFKFYMNLKSEGTTKTTDRIEGILDNVKNGIQYLKERKSFKLIMTTFEMTSICFLYKTKQYIKEGIEDAEILDAIQIRLATILKKNSIRSVYYTNSTVYESGRFGFLKIDITGTDEKNWQTIFERIEEYGSDIEVQIVTKSTKETEEEKPTKKEENPYSSSSNTTVVTKTTWTNTTESDGNGGTIIRYRKKTTKTTTIQQN